VTLSFFRFDTGMARLWALAMMGGARLSLARIPGLEFWKLCGSGTGQGFTPLPNMAVYAILCIWPDLRTAQAALAETAVFRRYRSRAAEHWTVFLTPVSSRGKWSGVAPFRPGEERPVNPLAALTRATIKPRIAMKFWRQVPDISQVIGQDENVAFKIGIGELPLLHQITFSIWPDAASMSRFARTDGPHARAISAVRSGDWFREELYARFHVLGDTGSWGGVSPLAKLERQS
jgi:spheroidene monooxygenase